MSKKNYLSPKDAIKGYLDAKAKDDVLFAEMYKKPNKDINACWAYIVGVAKKRGNAVCMTDDEVYGLAVHYYCEDDLKSEPIPKNFDCKLSTSEDADLSEEDKKKLRREAEAEFKAKVLKELEEEKEARVKAEKDAEKEKKRAEAERKRSEKEAAKVEAKRMKTAGMGCLFDF